MTLQAGAAVRDISPTRSLFLVGYPHVARDSIGIHDPLFASALYLKSDQTAIMLVAVDILFIGPALARDLRATIADQVGVPEAHVFISCTHTHSGPVTSHRVGFRGVPAPDADYMETFKAGIIAAASAAASDLHPAEIAWTAADGTGVGGNRHSRDGAADPEAGVLVVRHAERSTPLALSLTYSMHPTVLHEDNLLVSSDFPGYTRQHLQEAWGQDLVVLYHTGPSGNQSPRYHVTGQTFEEAERLGRLLGTRVFESVSQIPASRYTNEAGLSGGLRAADLPIRDLPSRPAAQEALAASRATYDKLKAEGAPHGPVRTAECAVFGAERQLDLAELADTGELEAIRAAYLPAKAQVVRIGDACLVGLPGEFFVEYGLAIKARAPCRAFVATLVNGELQGYMVTREAAAAGGYEAGNSLFAPGSGDRLVEAALQLLMDLGAD